MEKTNMQCALQKIIQNQLVQLCHEIDGGQSSEPCWGIKPSLVGSLCLQDENNVFFVSKVVWDFFQIHVSHASPTSQNTRKFGLGLVINELVKPFFSLSFQDRNAGWPRGVDHCSVSATKKRLLGYVTQWLKLSSEENIAKDSDAEDSGGEAWKDGTKMFWLINAMFRGACSSDSTGEGDLTNKNIQPWNFSMSETRKEGTKGAVEFLFTENEKIKESLKSTQQKIIDIQHEMVALHEKRKRPHDQDTHQDGFGLEEGQDVIKQYFDFKDQMDALDQAIQETKKQDMLNPDSDQSKKNDASLQQLDHALDAWVVSMHQLMEREDCSEDVKTFWAKYSALFHQRKQEASLKEKEKENKECLDSLRREAQVGHGYDVLWRQGLLFVGSNKCIARLNLNKFFQSKDESSSSERVDVPSWIYRPATTVLSNRESILNPVCSALSFDYHFLEGRKISDCKMHLSFSGYKNDFWNKRKPWSKMFLIDLLSKKCFVEFSTKKDRLADSGSFEYAIMNKLCKGVSALEEESLNQLIKQCLTEVGTRGVMKYKYGQGVLLDLMREQQNESPSLADVSPFLVDYVRSRSPASVSPVDYVRSRSPAFDSLDDKRTHASDSSDDRRTLFDAMRVKGKKQPLVKCYSFASSCRLCAMDISSSDNSFVK